MNLPLKHCARKAPEHFCTCVPRRNGSTFTGGSSLFTYQRPASACSVMAPVPVLATARCRKCGDYVGRLRRWRNASAASGRRSHRELRPDWLESGGHLPPRCVQAASACSRRRPAASLTTSGPCVEAEGRALALCRGGPECKSVAGGVLTAADVAIRRSFVLRAGDYQTLSRPPLFFRRARWLVTGRRVSAPPRRREKSLRRNPNALLQVPGAFPCRTQARYLLC
ncbi:hypothetical protein SKAU_G00150770 [Synaphobranchus kaupii]|uniref:Uncharacterized protein n=1 Tax=Synaphobranchus kaupii TaxID=118154 RepID=A0A9Q1FGK9_SYNKA|nr:hypothetical protein SKAU_G00150770 [Synaphobranchus kaupii]